MRLHFHRFMQMVHQELRKLHDVKIHLKLSGKKFRRKLKYYALMNFL